MAVTLVDDGLVYGGGQIGLRRYLQTASRLQRSVVLLTPNKVSHVRPVGAVPIFVAQERRGRRGLAAAWLRMLTSREIRRGIGNVVVANSLMSAVVVSALPRRGRTLIYYLREDLSPEWIQGVKRFLLEHLFLPRFDAFLANSSWTASTLPPRLQAKPIRVAYPLCGLSGRSGYVSVSQHAAVNEIRLLSLSRVAHWKGIDVVLDAAIELAEGEQRQVVLTIAGSIAPGDEYYALQLQARALPRNLRVDYAGHVENVDALLKSHDMLLVCSRHPEPFGQVVIQGLAAGLLLIATNQGGPSEILADQPTARLVPPNDAASTAQAMRELLTDTPTGQQRAAASADTLARFADIRLAAEFDAAVLSLAGATRQRTGAG